jgi:hypothetical protein
MVDRRIEQVAAGVALLAPVGSVVAGFGIALVRTTRRDGTALAA